MHSKITPEHLGRGAVVYVRQSTMGQVAEHTESQRRQYGLADSAPSLGFASVSVIDDDLGRSGSGLVERPGFHKLVAAVCSGLTGAVFCIEASRLGSGHSGDKPGNPLQRRGNLFGEEAARLWLQEARAAQRARPGGGGPSLLRSRSARSS
jgi:hypothetical protein